MISVQDDVLCNMQHKAGIPDNWILLDSQSTVDVFCNGKMLTNINEAKRDLTLHCNASTMSISKKGDLRSYGTVWYHLDGIANILSLNNIKKKYKVSYDSELDDGFIVHKGNRSQCVFFLNFLRRGSNDDLQKHTFWYCRIDMQQNKKTLMMSIEQVAQAYTARGF